MNIIATTIIMNRHLLLLLSLFLLLIPSLLLYKKWRIRKQRSRRCGARNCIWRIFSRLSILCSPTQALTNSLYCHPFEFSLTHPRKDWEHVLDDRSLGDTRERIRGNTAESLHFVSDATPVYFELCLSGSCTRESLRRPFKCRLE